MDVIPADAPGLDQFVKSLAEEGRAIVAASPLVEDTASVLAALRQVDEFARAELGIEAPAFSPEAALWGARMTYYLCQFVVCRDIGEEQIKAVCGVPCPEKRGPEADWSADLMLRHLPRLFQLARHLSNADPLVQQMRSIATAWPLSSVGVGGLEPVKLDSFVGHPALRRLYADRVISQADTSRLGDGRMDDLLRADFGLHRELAPAFAEKLFSQS